MVKRQGRGTFVADPTARTMLANSDIASPMLAFITFGLGHRFVSNMLAGMGGVAAQQGYPLHVIGSVKSSEEEARAINDAIRRGAQGIIVNPSREYRNEALYADLQARGFPLVMVDRHYREIATDYVVYADEQASYELTSALIGHGHTCIAFIPSQEQRTTSVRARSERLPACPGDAQLDL